MRRVAGWGGHSRSITEKMRPRCGRGTFGREPLDRRVAGHGIVCRSGRARAGQAMLVKGGGAEESLQARIPTLAHRLNGRYATRSDAQRTTDSKGLTDVTPHSQARASTRGRYYSQFCAARPPHPLEVGINL